MGIKLSITIVDTKENLNINSEYKNLNGKVLRTENLSPDDLHIGFYKDRVIILNEELIKIVDDKSELNVYENALSNRFIGCEIVHLIQFDTIGMAGYVIVENGEKIRAKAVADGQLYLDNDKPTEYEISRGANFKTAFLKEYPNSIPKVEEAIKNKSPKDELIYLLELQNKILENNITYFNGNFDLEFMHKVIPHFIDNDWFGFTKFEYVKYPKVNYLNNDLQFLDYIYDAYYKLNKTDTTHNMR